MSQENVETVRRGYELYAAGDLTSVAALFSHGAELADGGGLGVVGTAAGTLHGPDGFLRSASESMEVFADFHLETDDLIEAGDAVIAVVRIFGTGNVSGAHLTVRLAHLWVFGDDGKVIRGEVFRTTEDALKALGLEEYAVSQENVEIVRGVVEAFNSDEPRRAIAGFHPEIEFTSIGNALDGVAYLGLDGMGQYADDLESVFEHWHSQGDRLVDAGGEGRVASPHRRARQGEWISRRPVHRDRLDAPQWPHLARAGISDPQGG
ncbi:MAG TPA: nuclear transport factor 2 family protein, partial [Solirubrobacteraceae bacterium]|nr:nuclear transport factor 2 family protein [Solirubrobacteraceae bacterium]